LPRSRPWWHRGCVAFRDDSSEGAAFAAAAQVRAAIATAERRLEAHDPAGARAALGVAAQMLAREVVDPLLLARASWLAGCVDLAAGDAEDFEALSETSRQALSLAGAHAQATAVSAAKDEIVAQLADIRRMRERGAAGLHETLERLCDGLLELAAAGDPDDSRWARVDRERALLPALIAGAEGRGSGEVPLAVVIRTLGLDPAEAVLVATLAPLTTGDRPARWAALASAGPADEPERLAGLCFRDRDARAEATARLGPSGWLHRAGALATYRSASEFLREAWTTSSPS
jgi:hypothetical protein